MSLWAMNPISYAGLNICTKCEKLTTTKKLGCGHFLCEKCRSEDNIHHSKCLVCYDWNGKKLIFRTPISLYQPPKINELQTVQSTQSNSFALLNVKDIRALTDQKYEHERSSQLRRHHDVISFQELRRKLENAKLFIRSHKATTYTNLCHEIIAMVTAGDYDVMHENNDVIVEDIIEVVTLLSQKEEFECAFSLLYCSEDLCTQMAPSSGRAKSLQRLAGCVHGIAVSMVKEGLLREKFDEIGTPLLRKIRAHVRSNNRDVTDADDVTGCRFHEVWCLKHVALCAKYLKNYDVAISANREAISIADDVSGSDVIVSSEYDVILVRGMCHQNLASVYQIIGDVTNAKYFFSKAIEIYSTKNSNFCELVKEKIKQCETALSLFDC